jgi:hypothetical protein
MNTGFVRIIGDLLGKVGTSPSIAHFRTLQLKVGFKARGIFWITVKSR